MSKDSVITKFGNPIIFQEHKVQVTHLAAKQQYIISQQDGAGNQVCFASQTDNVVNKGGFQAGQLIIQNWKLAVVGTIDISAGDSLDTIVKKINAITHVHASIFKDDDGYRIIVESAEPGVKNTFYLAGDAIDSLRAVVPLSSVKFMDIYSQSGRGFSSLDQVVDSCQPGILNVGNGFVEVEPFDVMSLKLLKVSINKQSIATNVEANIIPFDQEDSSYIMRLTTKVGQHLNYTGGDVFTAQGSVQLKFSAAQDTNVIIDGIATSSPTDTIENSLLHNVKFTEVLGEQVQIEVIE